MASNDAGNNTIGAVIEIGSSTVRMRIVQLSAGGWRTLEKLEQSVRIGREVFSSRRISFGSVASLSDILKGFSQVMSEYGVKRLRTIATTALREASNRDYVVDLLRIQNGVTIDILEEGVESALAFSHMLNHYDQALHQGGTLMAYLGTGNLSLAYVRDGSVLYSGILPTGILRINRLLTDAQEQVSHFSDVLEEYVRTLINHVRIHLEGLHVDSLMLNSRLFLSNLPAQSGLVHTAGLSRMPLSKLNALYEPLRLAYRPSGIATEENDVFVPILAIVRELLTLTGATEVTIPDFEIADVLIDNMNSEEIRSRHRETIRRNVLSSAQHMAASFRCDLQHAERVKEVALRIFDSLRKQHGLGRRSRMLLEAAAWLHDVGYYISSRNHRATAFEILRNTTLFGLEDRDLFLIACVAGFDEYESSIDRFRSMVFTDEKDRILATKLAAILQLANTLDQSHTQRLEDPEVEIVEGRLVIRCRSVSAAVLERWALTRWTPAFEDVFGLQPELVVESTLIEG